MRVSLIRIIISIVIPVLIFSFGCKGSIPVSPEPAGQLKKINIFNVPAQLDQGQVHALGATGIYSGDAAMTITTLATWISNNAEVIIFSGKGLILPVGGGTATITCTYRGITSDPVTIFITGPPKPDTDVVTGSLQSIEISPVWEKITMGSTLQYTSVAHYSNGTMQDITNLVDWHVSDTGPGFIIDADNANAWGTNYGLYRATGPVGTAVVSCDYLGTISNYATVVVTEF